MLSHLIRSTFVDFFAHRGHSVVSSSSLIPYGDKTILFTNAGMNQFKNLFLGLEKRNYNRAVTAQKCMRVSGKHNDLENVGPSYRHHTFFEMLGNFSFGDYFKPDAQQFALELLLKNYDLPMERLWFTIFREDDEAASIWQKLGVPASRILRFDEKDNFWAMGDTGPCGPNSEIHFYTGKLSDNRPEFVNGDGEETVEIWNLVFMQYDRDITGKLTPLPRPSIDTGMGFERVCKVIQDVPTNYDTDLFVPVFDCIQELARHDDDQRLANIVPYRVIADHTRAASFLIADGVLPGNEGRNYVLRMILRRAARFGRKIGFVDPILFKVSESVIENMNGPYPELIDRRAHILNTIRQEEERFERTLDLGLERLNEIIDSSATPAVMGRSRAVISGDTAFKLYDTYGLPIEITRDEAKERGFEIDEAGFVSAREAARERNRTTSQFVENYDAMRSYGEVLETLKSESRLPASGVDHNPYGPLSLSTEVVALLRDGELTEHAVPGERIELLLRQTPFYVESGGQVSDTGTISAHVTAGEQPAWQVAVREMKRPAPGLILHVCEVGWGQPRIGDRCVANVDELRRWDIMRNHTATHLLQKALRSVLGSHVGQQGSLVAPDRMRFDFSHHAPMNRQELQQVAQMLNYAIMANYPVQATQESYKDALQSGALAFFSEKYGDVVRVLRIGNPGESPLSVELCGGTHVHRTGDIGSAIIVNETAVAAGVRRIEVVTGRGALDYVDKQLQQLAASAQLLNSSPETLSDQATKLVTSLAETQKELERLQHEMARAQFIDQLSHVQRINGATVLIAQVNAGSVELLREMSDWFREKYGSGISVLGAAINDKPSIVVSVSKDLTGRGMDAGKLAREIAKVVGGSGGGRPTLAQAGGKDAGKLGEALASATGLIESWFKP